MKMVEISCRSKMAELEKLNARLERAEKTLAKKQANAENLGILDWGFDEYRAWMDTVETANGFIVNKADVQRNGAWYDLIGAEREVKDIKERIENAEKRFEKAQEEVAKYREEISKIEDLKRKEELFKLEFEKEQKEWKKDGIELEGRYYGVTPKGKRFWIERNHGFTERSWHCFTLTIDGNTIFTSGEFWRAYAVVKNS